MINIVIPTTPERADRCNELIKSIQENTHDVEYRIIVYPNNLGGWVAGVYGAIAGMSDEDMVWLLGSDTILENNALKVLVDFYKETGNESAIVEPFNEFHGDTLCQHPFCKVKMIKKYLDKDFIHNFSDNWFTDLAIKDGNLYYQPNAVIQHRHWINKKAPYDSTYVTLMSSFERDQAMYMKKKYDKRN